MSDNFWDYFFKALPAVLVAILAYYNSRSNQRVEKTVVDTKTAVVATDVKINGRMSELLEKIGAEREKAGILEGIRQEQKRIADLLTASAEATAKVVAEEKKP